jgi:ribosomal-protein-alanine N-acetyltransferase
VPVQVGSAEDPSGIAIRPARRSDLPAALALEQSCFSAHQLARRQLHYLHNRATAIFLVAEEYGTGQLVGDCIALVRESGRGVRSGRIYSVAVHRDHRRRRLGRRLLSSMIDALASRGVRRVYLEVQHSNAAAISLYTALGFTPIGNLPDYYGPREHALHMMLQLPAAAAA